MSKQKDDTLFQEYKKAITELVTGRTEFNIIYNCNAKVDTPLEISNTGKKWLLVLDASFNPPHNAHAALFKSAVTQYISSASVDATNVEVLLLMATRNVDKPGQSVDQYAGRACMLRLFAEDLVATSNRKVKVDVGLTVHARFVDKFQQLFENHKTDRLQKGMNEQDDDLVVVFLVGFDTLVRILDPKYYPDSSVSEALGGDFEQKVRFMVLTREDDDSSQLSTFVGDNNDENSSAKDQARYVDQIRRGLLPGTPSIWASKIDLVPATRQSQGVSSTGVRRAVLEGDLNKLGAMVCLSVKDYILLHGLYK